MRGRSATDRRERNRRKMLMVVVVVVVVLLKLPMLQRSLFFLMQLNS